MKTVAVGRLPTGHLLAGHIVAQAGGQPYAGFLTEKILAPLELTSPFMISMSGSVLPAGEVGSGLPGDCFMICRRVAGLFRTCPGRPGSLARPGRRDLIGAW